MKKSFISFIIFTVAVGGFFVPYNRASADTFASQSGATPFIFNSNVNGWAQTIHFDSDFVVVDGFQLQMALSKCNIGSAPDSTFTAHFYEGTDPDSLGTEIATSDGVFKTGLELSNGTDCSDWEASDGGSDDIPEAWVLNFDFDVSALMDNNDYILIVAAGGGHSFSVVGNRFDNDYADGEAQCKNGGAYGNQASFGGTSVCPLDMWFTLEGQSANDQVSFSYPADSQTVGTSWRWEWEYMVATPQAVEFVINLCPQSSSCANQTVVPATFNATNSLQDGQYVQNIIVTPGAKTGTITMRNSTTDETITTDTVDFTVASNGESNVEGGGGFGTSTQDISFLSCAFTLEIPLAEDINLDPCALLAWIIIPPRNPDTGQYFFIEAWLDIDFLGKQPASYVMQIKDFFEAMESQTASNGDVSVALPAWFTTGEVGSSTEVFVILDEDKFGAIFGAYASFHLAILTAGLWLLFVVYIFRRVVSGSSVEEDLS